MKSLIESQFGYCPVIWVFHSRGLNNKVVPDIFLFIKKALYEVKASGLQLTFNIFR